MKRQEWLVQALAAAGDRGLDPVQLQKALFLFKERGRYAIDSFYPFVPHNYGPFAAAIYADADDLEREGLVVKIRRRDRSWSTFALTELGRQHAVAMRRSIPDDGVAFLRSTVDWVKAQSFSDLVEEIYRLYPKYRVNSIFRS
jgi:hypothetical protein